MGLLFPEEKKYCGNFFPEKNNYPTMTFSTIQKSHNIFFSQVFLGCRAAVTLFMTRPKKKTLHTMLMFFLFSTITTEYVVVPHIRCRSADQHTAQQQVQKKHSHGPTYRANTATLHRRAVDSMPRGGRERGMHHTLPATSISTYFDQ